MMASESLSSWISPGCSDGGSTVYAMIVGTARPIIARNSIDDWKPMFSLLNFCSLNRNPPATTLRPNMRRMLPIIAPVIDAFTRSSRPALMATIAIMISAALPKVTLRSDPTVGP